jgi:hypothetical protein
VSAEGLFAEAQQFPDESARVRYEHLVGIDAIKRQLVGEAHAMLDPSVVERWSMHAHQW